VKTNKRISGVLVGILTIQLRVAKGWEVAATTRDDRQRIVVGRCYPEQRDTNEERPRAGPGR
jgi:hypothetical protein